MAKNIQSHLNDLARAYEAGDDLDEEDVGVQTKEKFVKKQYGKYTTSQYKEFMRKIKKDPDSWFNEHDL